MTEKKAYLAIISTVDRKAIDSKWFTSIVSAQNWAEKYETNCVYIVSIFDEVSDPPVLEYTINPAHFIE